MIRTTVAAVANLLLNLNIVGIVFMVLGLIFVIIEMFIPGFGIMGGLGAVLLLASIFLTANSVIEGVIIFTIILAILIVAMIFVINRAKKGKLLKGVILNEEENEEDMSNDDLEFFIGKKGVALTQLRPAGCIDLDGVKLDVVTNGDFIDKGKEVEIIKVDGIRIIVKEI